MGREYTYIKSLTNPGTTNPVIQIAAPATMAYRVKRLAVTCNTTTSAAAELKVQRLSAAATVSAAAATDFGKHSSGDPNISLTFGTSATGFTGTSTGTTTGAPLIDEFFNVLNGYQWFPTPEIQIEIPPSGFLALYTPTSANIAFNFMITLEEIG